MRFVHTADMHFDAPFTALSAKALGDVRRLEQRKVFSKLIDYVREEKIPFLFISGDLYEHKYIRRSTIEYINDLFKTIPNTKIFISPGNHDPFLKNSFYNTFNWNENVHIFNNEVGIYELPEADIYGYGFDDFYCTDFNIANIKIKNPEKTNILILHGDLDASSASEMQYNPLNRAKLKEAGFSYIALGHIHKPNYEENTNIVYPGSMISFGFDELGERGMLDVEIDEKGVRKKFIKLDDRTFEELSFDISEIYSSEELIEKINNLKLKENTLYKLILIGNKNFEININKIIKLIIQENILKIKNNSKLNQNIDKILEEKNLKSFFITEIMNKFEKKEINKEIMMKAIELGLEVL